MGRLQAWKAIGAMCLLPPDAAFEEVHERAGSLAWYEAVPNTEWFARIAWDLAFVGVDSELGRIALVCGTDTD